MGQDSQFCEKCGKPCGYDDNKAYFDPGYLCGQCKLHIICRLNAFFGVDWSGDENSIYVSWRDADKILSKIKRDASLKISYLVTDKEMYLRRTDILTPIIE